MNQSVNNTARTSHGMSVAAAMDGATAPWGGQTMEWSAGVPAGGNYRGNGQSASEIFREMSGSMSNQLYNNSMSGSMPWTASSPAPGGMQGSTAAWNMGPGAHISTPEETSMQQLDLSIGLPQEAIENPTSLLEARLASLRHLLSKLVGHYVIVTFLIGTQNSVSWEGFLHTVGNDFIVIFQPDTGRYITGDMFSLKFVEFYEEKGVIPPCIGSRRRDAQNMW